MHYVRSSDFFPIRLVCIAIPARTRWIHSGIIACCRGSWSILRLKLHGCGTRVKRIDRRYVRWCGRWKWGRSPWHFKNHVWRSASQNRIALEKLATLQDELDALACFFGNEITVLPWHSWNLRWISILLVLKFLHFFTFSTFLQGTRARCLSFLYWVLVSSKLMLPLIFMGLSKILAFVIFAFLKLAKFEMFVWLEKLIVVSIGETSEQVSWLVEKYKNKTNQKLYALAFPLNLLIALLKWNQSNHYTILFGFIRYPHQIISTIILTRTLPQKILLICSMVNKIRSFFDTYINIQSSSLFSPGKIVGR